MIKTLVHDMTVETEHSKLEGIPLHFVRCSCGHEGVRFSDPGRAVDSALRHARERCEVCGTRVARGGERCTNGRCLSCHEAWCGPGGSISPGHGRRWPEGAKRGAVLGAISLPQGG